MTIWQAAILGLVQGVTEFLPISSSGHLVLFQQFFEVSGDILTFDIFIHLATLVAILVFFGKTLFKVTLKEWVWVGIGTIPAVIIGLVFKDQIEAMFLNDRFLGIELMITGLINFYTDRKLNHKKVSEVKDEVLEKVNVVPAMNQGPTKSLLIGIAQAFAIIPGISRSGSTVAAGIGLGMNRDAAFRYSFLLAIPALLGAGILQGFDLVQSGPVVLDIPVLLAGGITAFVGGLASLKLFKYVIQKAKLEWFGWYCVILGLVILVLPFISSLN